MSDIYLITTINQVTIWPQIVGITVLHIGYYVIEIFLWWLIRCNKETAIIKLWFLFFKLLKISIKKPAHFVLFKPDHVQKKRYYLPKWHHRSCFNRWLQLTYYHRAVRSYRFIISAWSWRISMKDLSTSLPVCAMKPYSAPWQEVGVTNPISSVPL